MNVEVLIVTMNQSDFSLISKMNIKTDAIIGNQCSRNGVHEFECNGQRIRMYSFNEKGVGLNRNTILMRAESDIVLFADDDVVYFDDYENTILSAYRDNPEADAILFNLTERKKQGAEVYKKNLVEKKKQINRFNYGRYGTVCFSAKLCKLREKNIYFHLDFGGGTKYSCGEDTIFLRDCIHKKMKIITVDHTIGVVNTESSTWFTGINEKYIYDKGVIFGYMYPKLGVIVVVYHFLKHIKDYKSFGLFSALKKMLEGVERGKCMVK